MFSWHKRCFYDMARDFMPAQGKPRLGW